MPQEINSIKPRKAAATARERISSLSPDSRQTVEKGAWSPVAQAIHTVPTGFFGVPPPGPAIPEMPTLI